ncbi:hypothetical protein CCP3SC15_610006 [Gammaproteobacteria bacterium]
MVNSCKVYNNTGDDLVIASGGTLTIESGATVTRSVVKKIPAANGRVGSGAGFTNASNTGAVLLPASQSASTWVVPISGLKIGDIITGFKVVAQVESAGGTVTIDADLRKLTNAAADPSDASLGAITQVSVTADTAVAASKTLSAAETVASGTTCYVLVTATTAGSTDIQLLGIELNVTEA